MLLFGNLNIIKILYILIESTLLKNQQNRIKMEDGNLLDSNIGDGFVITESSRSFLRETAKWAKFLAIVGFVMVGLMVLFGLFFGSIMGAAMTGMEDAGLEQALGGGAFGFIYVVIALLYFFPTLYLYRFATRTKQALANSDSEGLAWGLEQLKSCFKFMGIMMIVMLSFYAIIFVFVIIFGAAMAF